MFFFFLLPKRVDGNNSFPQVGIDPTLVDFTVGPYVTTLQRPLIKFKFISIIFWLYVYDETSRGEAAQSMTVNATDCGFDTHSKK